MNVAPYGPYCVGCHIHLLIRAQYWAESVRNHRQGRRVTAKQQVTSVMGNGGREVTGHAGSSALGGQVRAG
jgi:hypothetical protein